jgi:hypothetical protein
MENVGGCVNAPPTFSIFNMGYINPGGKCATCAFSTNSMEYKKGVLFGAIKWI